MPAKEVSHWKEYRAALSGEYLCIFTIQYFRLENVDFSAVNIVNILSGCQCGNVVMVCRRFTAFTEIPRKPFLLLAAPYPYRGQRERR